MKSIRLLIACVGLLVPAVADSLVPHNSRTLLIDDDTSIEQLVVWQQCGDKAGPWPGKSCVTGPCVRVNDWYMQCIPDEDPSFLSQLMPNVLQPWEACNALHNPKAVCPQGYTCVWFDKWYSQCRPAQTEVTATPPQAQLLEAATHSGQPADKAAQLQALNLWSQCGGEGGCSGDSPCSDAAWSTATCPAGSACVRDSQWFWQCRPSQDAAMAAAAAPTGRTMAASPPASATRLSLWKQCGGKGGCGSNLPCADQAWTTAACLPGSSCVRNSAWFYQCRPNKASTSATAAAAAATLTFWAQCGGKGSCKGPSGPCADHTWTKGPQCAAGSSCVRLSSWFWQCQPGGAAAAAAAAAGGGGTAGGSAKSAAATGGGSSPGKPATEAAAAAAAAAAAGSKGAKPPTLTTVAKGTATPGATGAGSAGTSAGGGTAPAAAAAAAAQQQKGREAAAAHTRGAPGAATAPSSAANRTAAATSTAASAAAAAAAATAQQQKGQEGGGKTASPAGPKVATAGPQGSLKTRGAAGTTAAAAAANTTAAAKTAAAGVAAATAAAAAAAAAAAGRTNATATTAGVTSRAGNATAQKTPPAGQQVDAANATAAKSTSRGVTEPKEKAAAQQNAQQKAAGTNATATTPAAATATAKDAGATAAAGNATAANDTAAGGVNGTTAAGNTSQPAGTGGAAAPTAELTFPGLTPDQFQGDSPAAAATRDAVSKVTGVPADQIQTSFAAAPGSRRLLQQAGTTATITLPNQEAVDKLRAAASKDTANAGSSSSSSSGSTSYSGPGLLEALESAFSARGLPAPDVSAVTVGGEKLDVSRKKGSGSSSEAAAAGGATASRGMNADSTSILAGVLGAICALIGLICLALYLYSKKHGSLPCRCCQPEFAEETQYTEKQQLDKGQQQQQQQRDQARSAAVGAGAGPASSSSGGTSWRGKLSGDRNKEGMHDSEIQPAGYSDINAGRDVGGAKQHLDTYDKEYDPVAVEEPAYREYEAAPVQEPMHGGRAAGGSSSSRTAAGVGAAAAAGTAAAAAMMTAGRRDQSKGAEAEDADNWGTRGQYSSFAAANEAEEDAPRRDAASRAASASRSDGAGAAGAAGAASAPSDPAAVGRDSGTAASRPAGAGAGAGATAAAGGAAGIGLAAMFRNWRTGDSRAAAATTAAPGDTAAVSQADISAGRDDACVSAGGAPSETASIGRDSATAADTSAAAAAAGGAATGGGLAGKIRSWRSIDSRAAATETVPWDTPTASEADLAGEQQAGGIDTASQCSSSGALAAAAAGVGVVAAGGAAAAGAAHRDASAAGPTYTSSSSKAAGARQQHQTGLPASRLARMTSVGAATETVDWDTPPGSEGGSFEPQRKGSTSGAAAAVAAATAAGAATARAAAAKLRASSQQKLTRSVISAGAAPGTPPDTPSRAAEARTGGGRVRPHQQASIDSRDAASNVLPYDGAADSDAGSSAALAAAAAAAAAGGSAAAVAETRADRSSKVGGAAAAGDVGAGAGAAAGAGWGTWFSSWWADKEDGSDLPASRVVADTEVVPGQQVNQQEPWMDIGQLRSTYSRPTTPEVSRPTSDIGTGPSSPAYFGATTAAAAAAAAAARAAASPAASPTAGRPVIASYPISVEPSSPTNTVASTISSGAWQPQPAYVGPATSSDPARMARRRLMQ